ncbi:MAG: (2Fe-2S)-binding protein [Stutzerimonas stutzeri]
MVRETIRANRLSSVEDVTNYTKAGGGCSSCHEGIERLLVEELAARGEIFVPAGTGAKAAKKAKAPLVTLETPPVAPQAAPTAPRLTTLQRIRRVEARARIDAPDPAARPRRRRVAGCRGQEHLRQADRRLHRLPDGQHDAVRHPAAADRGARRVRQGGPGQLPGPQRDGGGVR